MTQTAPLQVLIAGSADFVRRMSFAASRLKSQLPIEASEANLAELKAVAIEQRPDLLLVEIGYRASRGDIEWLRSALSDLRERFDRRLYVVAAVPSPEKFAFAGNLLFKDDTTLSPSGLIDNFIIGAPPGFPAADSLEEQLENMLRCYHELLTACDGENPLPALWSDDWIPAMCDPHTRTVWMRWVPRYAKYVNENPLILGPTGSGKTRLAAALHRLSGRKGVFVSITPRDFSSNELIQAELFGAVAGAYTGAVDKWGLVKKADKGTLFIDELQSIDFDLQGKLITFIENKTYRRVGEAESHFADVRFVFATNVPLEDLVKSKRLRDDFAYRLERLKLELKPLQERRLDISAGACFALAKVLRERNQATGGNQKAPDVEGLSLNAYRKVFSANWPGNLRQLENTLAKMIELASIRRLHLIDEDCVDEAVQGLLGYAKPNGQEIFAEAAARAVKAADQSGPASLQTLVQAIAEFARMIALERSGGDAEEAAALIGESSKAMELFLAAREGL